MIIKREHKNSFTIIDNKMLQDASLSFAARGLLGYMLSMPADWKFYEKELVNHTTDGKHAIHSSMQELIQAGYVYKTGQREHTYYYVDDAPHSVEDWETYAGPLPEIRKAFTENQKSLSRKSEKPLPEIRKAFTENRQIQNKHYKINITKERDAPNGAPAPSAEKIIPKPKVIPPRKIIPPTVEMVSAYCKERGNSVDAQRFVDYYTANGWRVGKNPMKDWQAAVRTWERNGYDTDKQRGTPLTKHHSQIGSWGDEGDKPWEKLNRPMK